MFSPPPDDIALFAPHFHAACRESAEKGAALAASFIEARQKEGGRSAGVVFDTLADRLTRGAFQTACLETSSFLIPDARRATQAFWRECQLTPAEQEALTLAARRLGVPFALERR